MTSSFAGAAALAGRRRLLALLSLVVLAVAAVPSLAADPPPALVIIAHEKNPMKAVTHDELRNIWLGRLGFWSDNSAVRVFDRPIDRDAGQAFYRDILKMVPARFRHHWQAQQLSGRGIAPEPIAAVDAVVALVAATPGGISYLHTTEVPALLPKGVVVVPFAAKR